jgi:hypothetical protein
MVQDDNNVYWLPHPVGDTTTWNVNTVYESGGSATQLAIGEPDVHHLVLSIDELTLYYLRQTVPQTDLVTWEIAAVPTDGSQLPTALVGGITAPDILAGSVDWAPITASSPPQVLYYLQAPGHRDRDHGVLDQTLADGTGGPLVQDRHNVYRVLGDTVLQVAPQGQRDREPGDRHRAGPVDRRDRHDRRRLRAVGAAARRRRRLRVPGHERVRGRLAEPGDLRRELSGRVDPRRPDLRGATRHRRHQRLLRRPDGVLGALLHGLIPPHHVAAPC